MQSDETLKIPQSEAPSVVGTETRHENKVLAKPFTVYQVTMVNTEGKKCSVYRRYNDFLGLHNKVLFWPDKDCPLLLPFVLTLHLPPFQLIKLFPNEKLPPFPPKRILGNNFDPKFIESRREMLHTYTQAVLLKPHIRRRSLILSIPIPSIGNPGFTFLLLLLLFFFTSLSQ